jgi:hypothetical protein
MPMSGMLPKIKSFSFLSFNFFRNGANIMYCFEINAEDLKIDRKIEEPISSQDERAPRRERGKTFSAEEPGTRY